MTKKTNESDHIDYNASTINNLRHLHDKSMWAGSSKKLVEERLISFEIKADEKKLIHRPCKVAIYSSLTKCYDELIVNAVDHIAACRELSRDQQVSFIDVSYNTSTGEFKIRNDGKGIDVSMYPPGDEHAGKYKPYVYFTEEKQGSNSFKEEKCVKAGTNGYGTKIVLARSEKMTVSCGNKTQGRTYTHTHINDPETGKFIMGEPKIRNKSTSDYTEISFIPISKGPMAYAKEVSKKDIELWLIRRLVFIVSYTSTLIKTFGLRPVKFTFNKMDISWVTLSHIAESYKKPDTEIVSIILTPKKDMVELSDGTEVMLYPMEFLLCVRNDADKVSIISNTNGTLIYEGDHFQMLSDQISDAIIAKISKTLNNSEITLTPDNIRAVCLMFMNAIIPGLEFSEQSKKRANVDEIICQQYVIKDKDIKQIVSMISRLILDKNLAKLQKKQRSKIKLSDKFIDARSRNKDRSDFILMVCEGDSAMSNISGCMSSLDDKFDIDKIGYITLFGGVPNVRKSCTVLYEGTPEEFIVVDDMTMNNVFVNTLQKALGVEINSPVDREKLRYGKIIACVDQDLDGKGKLFGLLVNLLHYFWKDLFVTNDFVTKLDTPIKRIYKPGNILVEKFCYEHEYQAWREAHKESSKNKIKYYKGLATHGPKEMRDICRNIFENTKALELDFLANILIGKYYDEDSDARKVILRKPLTFADKYYARGVGKDSIKISNYLNSDLFLFAKDDIIRKLPSAIDGLNSSGRKIVNGIITKLKTKDEKKVAELGGSITESQNYHHGEKCLEDNIKNKCFISVGGRQLPLLLPHGAFGNRLCGGELAGESRYIHSSHNIDLTELLYPAEDYGMLHFTADDGKYYEPDYFVPIVPMAILETAGMPAHGWNFQVIARDIFAVINCVRSMIINPTYTPMTMLPMALHGFHGKYYHDLLKNTEQTEGVYTYTEDCISITEIPIGVWINKYVEELTEKIRFYNLDANIGAVRLADDHTLRLNIYVDPEFWDKVAPDGKYAMSKISNKFLEKAFGKDYQKNKKKLVQKKKGGSKKGTKGSKKSGKGSKKDSTDDDIEAKKVKKNKKSKNNFVVEGFDKTLPEGEKYNLDSFLGLVKKHKTSLNMVASDASVIEFGNDYFGVVKYWFDFRRQMYIDRVTRQLIIFELEIEMLHDEIKFISEYDTSVKKPIKVIKQDLSNMGIRAFNHVLVATPGKVPASELRERCVSNAENSDLKISYDYVLNIGAGKLSSTEYLQDLKKRYCAKCIKLEIYKNNVTFGQFKGAMLWLQELDALEKLVKTNLPTWWGTL